MDAAADAAEIDAAILPCAPTPAGLVARWRGNNNANDDLGRYNAMGNGHPAYTAGRHGAAFAFNHNDTVFTAADNDALWPTGSFSIEAWVATDTLAASGIVGKYDCGGACPAGGPPMAPSSWGLHIDANGHPGFGMRTSSVAEIALDDLQRVVSDGAWHYLVGVRDVDARQATLYIDGAQALVTPLSGGQLDPLSNADREVDPVTIGASRVIVTHTGDPLYAQYLTGAIDDVAYYTSALTADEIRAIYSSRDGECP
jgi:hypothetical protein